MTHYYVLVIGPGEALDAQLAPFSEDLDVDPYFRALDETSLAGMRAQYGIAENAPLDTYVDFVADWAGAPGTIHAGQLGYLTRYNPHAKWDYWRPVRLPTRSGGEATTVRKKDLDLSPRNPFATEDGTLGVWAVLAEGVWREPGQVGWFGSTRAGDNDIDRFTGWYRTFFDALDGDAELTVVDCHI